MGARSLGKVVFLAALNIFSTLSFAAEEELKRLSLAETPPSSSSLNNAMSGDRLGEAIRRDLLEKTELAKEEDAADRQALYSFYEEHEDKPLFVGKTGYNEKASSLIAELSKANDWGLNSNDFPIIDLGGENSQKPELSLSQRVESEKTLALMVLKYARYARGGRIPDPPHQLSSYLDRTPQYIEPKKFLGEIASSDNPAAVLRGTNPQNPQFEKLRQKYLELKRMEDSSIARVKIPLKGPTLLPGQSHEDIALLRNHFEASTARPEENVQNATTFYDDALVEQLKNFQKEKGLKADGVLNAKTRNALNSIEKPNLEQLIANMEMWRWMPEDLGEFYVWVNIPEFLVRVVKNGQIIHEERIVSGTTQNQTPIFSDTMEAIYFNPRWNVPESIKILEVYPSLLRSKGKKTQGLTLLYNGRPVDASKIDWKLTDIRRFDIYQAPGSSNVLGVVKFTFPNKHSVYLHDTSTKNLFNADVRTFSHGCMRVRNPMKLAEVLLAEDRGWGAEQVRDLQKSKSDEIPIILEKKIPIHVTYFTALVDESGKTKTLKDFYGHEQRVKLALDGRFDQIARGRDHLAPVPFANTQFAESSEDWGLFFGAGQRTDRYDQNNTASNDFFNNFFGGL